MIRLAALCAALCACTGFPLPGPEPTPEPEHVRDCRAYCGNLARLGCPDAEPTPEGDSCEAVCVNMVISNVPVPLQCGAQASSCQDAHACGLAPEDRSDG